MWRLLRLSWLALAAQLFWAMPAQAQRSGAGDALCTVATTPLSFGNYEGVRQGPTDVAATITVSCNPAAGTPTATVSFTIALAGGGAAGQRQLSSARDGIRYELYTDPGRSLVFGDGTGGSTTLSGSGLATRLVPLRQSFTVYGRILARQRRAGAGAYADSMIVRLSW